MVAMLNDPLTSKRTILDNPSPFDLDTPLCMTASSLTTDMVGFLENHHDPDKEGKLSDFKRFAEIQESQVFVEVGRVRPELLSPFGGIDPSFTVQTEDGTEYTAKPARRGESRFCKQEFANYHEAPHHSKNAAREDDGTARQQHVD